jgi:hypothetical protein
MAYCVILYKVLVGEEERIVIDFHKGEVVVWKSAVMPLVRMLEKEFENVLNRSANELANVGMGFRAMNPSVVFVGLNRDNVYEWGIVNRTHDIERLTFFGSRQFMVVGCNGPKAMFFWEKGIKPQYPEEKVNDSKDRGPDIPA